MTVENFFVSILKGIEFLIFFLHRIRFKQDMDPVQNCLDPLVLVPSPPCKEVAPDDNPPGGRRDR